MRLSTKRFSIIGVVVALLCLFLLYSSFMDVPHPISRSHDFQNIEKRLDILQTELDSQLVQSNQLLMKISELKLEKEKKKKSIDNGAEKSGDLPKELVLPILVIACDRVTVARCLENLVKYRPDKKLFPIIVSQDCGHNATYQVIKSFVDADPSITVVKQPDQSAIPLPRSKVKFSGYYKIARHFKFALDHVFNTLGHEAVIIVEGDQSKTGSRSRLLNICNQGLTSITVAKQPDQYPAAEVKGQVQRVLQDSEKLQVDTLGHEAVIIIEDDLDIAPDFYEYFLGTYPLLLEDSSLWCISAWNDNGKRDVIDVSSPELLHRTDFFPGLGWLLRKETWTKLQPKWPPAFFDDWLRNPENTEGKACIRPEISRTHTFGKIGVSKGLFYENHLKSMYLNTKYVEFANLDLSYLLKNFYDPALEEKVSSLPSVTAEELEAMPRGSDSVKVIYNNAKSFQHNARMLGLMDDFRSGVPRTAYRGIVTCMYRGRRVYLAPVFQWERYDPSWG